MVSKALWAAFVHSKLPFFMYLVKGAIVELKPLMNRRWKEDNPWKLHTSVTEVGVGASIIVPTLDSST